MPTGLFAAAPRLDPASDSMLLIVLVVFFTVLVFGFLLLFVKRYQRCPANRVLVIYGKLGGGRSLRCLHGGAAFVLPLIQDFAWLDLEPVEVELPPGVADRPPAGVAVPRSFTVAVGTTPELMNAAAQRLLGLTPDEVRRRARDVIAGTVERALVAPAGTPDDFLAALEPALRRDLAGLGLVLVSFRGGDRPLSHRE